MTDDEEEELYETSDCLEDADAFEGLLSGCLNCDVCSDCIERSIVAVEQPMEESPCDICNGTWFPGTTERGCPRCNPLATPPLKRHNE